MTLDETRTMALFAAAIARIVSFGRTMMSGIGLLTETKALAFRLVLRIPFNVDCPFASSDCQYFPAATAVFASARLWAVLIASARRASENRTNARCQSLVAFSPSLVCNDCNPDNVTEACSSPAISLEVLLSALRCAAAIAPTPARSPSRVAAPRLSSAAAAGGSFVWRGGSHVGSTPADRASCSVLAGQNLIFSPRSSRAALHSLAQAFLSSGIQSRAETASTLFCFAASTPPIGRS